MFYLSGDAPSPVRRFRGMRSSLPHPGLSIGSEAVEVRNGWTPSANLDPPSSIHDPPSLPDPPSAILDLPSWIPDLRPWTLDHLASLLPGQRRHRFPSVRFFSHQCRGCAGAVLHSRRCFANFHSHVEHSRQSAMCRHRHCVSARCSPASSCFHRHCSSCGGRFYG